MPATLPASGSARRHGPLWGARARAWADNEARQAPTYEAALRRVAVAPGDRVLDVGCGSGVFLRAAADRGARVCGLDASEALLEIARERVPEADLAVGDMEQLPHGDDTFDLVTGFNAFFFAADMTAALREARRVARPGAAVVIQVWGRPDRCDLTAMRQAVGRLMPAPPSGAVPQRGLWEPGVLEEIATAAGLVPEAAFDTSWAFAYEDDAALARGMLAPGLVVEAARAVGEEPVRRAILDALAPYRTADGGYRLENEWHYLIARA
jgi:SAM-dependent methyltransferase